MSVSDPSLEEQAMARIRATLVARDGDPPDVDDDALLALIRGELAGEREAEVMTALAGSAGLRAYLVEASRPVDPDRLARALGAMAPLPRLTLDPFRDPLAPVAPAGYDVSGPFGRIRAEMQGDAWSSAAGSGAAEPDEDIAFFGPDSTLEWIVRSDGHSPLPAAFALWLRPVDGRYERAPDPRVQPGASAVRLSIAAARLFPAAGSWQVALTAGAEPDGPDACLRETWARFSVDPLSLA